MLAVESSIAGGKSLLSELIAKRLNITNVEEPVDDNPYLESYYNNPKDFALLLQIWLLHRRFKDHFFANMSNKQCVLDRSLYGDRIFAVLQYEQNLMTKDEFDVYCSAYDTMSKFLCPPELVIYLAGTLDTHMERLKIRGRECVRI